MPKDNTYDKLSELFSNTTDRDLINSKHRVDSNTAHDLLSISAVRNERKDAHVNKLISNLGLVP